MWPHWCHSSFETREDALLRMRSGKGDREEETNRFEYASKQRTLPVVLRRRRRLARRSLLRGRLLRRPLLVGDRQQQLRVVIDDAIDARGNLVPGELAFGRPAQQRHDVVGVVRAAVEP